MVSDFNFSNLLEDPIDEAELGWTLCFIGDSQQTKLAELVQELKGDFSETGDGKRILSGYSYWGIGPTISWAKTCADPFYPVMRGSIRSFKSRWDRIFSRNFSSDENFYYVSLGVGTGEKDQRILGSLLAIDSDTVYFPVDMSSTMLRIATQEVTRIEKMKGSQILPIQIDFSYESRIESLRDLLGQLASSHSILFSLLGNTLANFSLDSELLKRVAGLMRKNDFLLLEVASTKELSSKAVQEAKNEYSRIESFRKFATSALLQNTNLQIDLDSVRFHSHIEQDKAVLVKIVYQNLTGEAVQIMLPDWSSIELPSNDTIRLQLTRKYTPGGIESIIRENGLTIVDRVTASLSDQSNSLFGMDLILLTTSGAERESKDSSPLGPSVWPPV